MSELEPILQAELDKALRRLCRQLGAQIVHAMAMTDSSIEQISERTGHEAKRLKRFLDNLIKGVAPAEALDVISDIAWAMDCEVRLSLLELPKPNPSPSAEGETKCD